MFLVPALASSLLFRLKAGLQTTYTNPCKILLRLGLVLRVQKVLRLKNKLLIEVILIDSLAVDVLKRTNSTHKF